jgi:uncharacterized SAM-binding protein YcdF (DUF218 family)
MLIVAVVYFGTTFVQVVLASRRDGARPAQAIVVFGAAQYDGRPSPVLKARLDHAADLYYRDLADTIFVTGGKRPGDRTNEAGAAHDYLVVNRGVPSDRILRETAGTDSWHSLASAANELRKLDMHVVLLVSDPFHNARIAAMARELGLEASVSPTRTSPIDGSTEWNHFVRETAAVGLGRVVGFGRLMGVEREVERVRNRSRDR